MLLGQSIGPFAIEKELGSGAMGTVYLARHESGTKVAIKIMAPGLSSKVATERFKRESDILKQLKHPNIVRLIASGKYHGNPFYAMEYIEGESLDHVMARRGRITWEELIPLGQQLCAGLQYAHERGIVHRDLKPSNLMVLADGTVKLTDFGIAKDLDVTQLTAANCTVGTAAYMSPEQCRGDPNISSKSDLYSMGVMFYELVTGRKPFVADSAMVMFELHVSGQFERPSRLVLDIPIWLDTLICQLMEKKPEQRPYNAEAVAQALGRVKEKVEAQLSAGVDVAKQRKIDRSTVQAKLDETDKEAARTLLHKKKKKKKVPFYRKGWFQAVGLSVILLAVVYVIYVTFIKAPSAESLFREVQRLAESDDLEVRREARRGPIPDFLRYYPDDPKAAKVRQWDDEIARDEQEIQMHKRRGLFKAADAAEKLARTALEDEEAGKLTEAAKTWKDLVAFKNKGGGDRIWALVAEKYLRDHQAVDPLYADLQKRVEKEKAPDKETKKAPETLEGLALGAVRAMRRKDSKQAQDKWEELRKLTEGDISQRRWFFLAVFRLQEQETADHPKGKKK
jgi:serine/threonine-protein kinase